MAEFVKVATTDQIPEGAMLKVDRNGKKVLVANIGGKFYAMDRICSHKGGPLDEGELDGKIVTCPWHGGKFDVTSGKVKQGPPQKDEAAYEVHVEGKDILVKL
jgi:nitrite reductase/ring-hydroxylating ferredoxin subunit